MASPFPPTRTWPSERTDVPALLALVKNYPFDCPSCRARFKTMSEVQQHAVEAKHVLKCPPLTEEEQQKMECPKCFRPFDQRYRLKRHFLVHTGEKPYTCTICKKQFSQRGNLNQHIKIHETSVKCEACGKNFKKGTKHVCSGKRATKSKTHEAETRTKTKRKRPATGSSSSKSQRSVESTHHPPTHHPPKFSRAQPLQQGAAAAAGGMGMVQPQLQPHLSHLNSGSSTWVDVASYPGSVKSYPSRVYYSHPSDRKNHPPHGVRRFDAARAYAPAPPPELWSPLNSYDQLNQQLRHERQQQLHMAYGYSPTTGQPTVAPPQAAGQPPPSYHHPLRSKPLSPDR